MIWVNFDQVMQHLIPKFQKRSQFFQYFAFFSIRKVASHMIFPFLELLKNYPQQRKSHMTKVTWPKSHDSIEISIDIDIEHYWLVLTTAIHGVGTRYWQSRPQTPLSCRSYRRLMGLLLCNMITSQPRPVEVGSWSYYKAYRRWLVLRPYSILVAPTSPSLSSLTWLMLYILFRFYWLSKQVRGLVAAEAT